MKNASTKSVILAPFNSTKSHLSSFGSSVRNNIFEKHEKIKFLAKVRELDRQYEGNNNSKLDNGVYNKFANNSGLGENLSDSSTPSEYAPLPSAKSTGKELDAEEEIKAQVAQFCPNSG